MPGDFGPEHSGQGQAGAVLRSCSVMLAGEVDLHLIEPLIAGQGTGQRNIH